MRKRIPSLLAAGYLLLCILIGGSMQGVWTNLALQIVGLALIALAAIVPVRSESSARSRPLYLLFLAALLVVLVQLIPLPANLWAGLPGRHEIAEDLALLGYALPAAPLSLTPYASVAALLTTIPALAAFVVTDRLAASPRAIALAVVTGMVLGTLLGAVQVAGGPGSPAYLYEFHSPGAVGFFANRNHMATLLLVAIPMAAALFVWARSAIRKPSSLLGVGIALVLLAAVGIVLNGSQAALGLIVPVLLATSALLPIARAWRGLALGGSALTFVAGILMVATNPIGAAPSTDSTSGLESRVAIWTITTEAIEDSFPAGTGFGSYEEVYRLYEQPDRVTRRFVNHAHNDYLQTVLELGLPGLLLLLLFLSWWGFSVVRIWTSPAATVFSRAATIVTAVILAHSVVEFPLRTAAISAIFAASLALMTRYDRPSRDASGQTLAKRHVTLG